MASSYWRSPAYTSGTITVPLILYILHRRPPASGTLLTLVLPAARWSCDNEGDATRREEKSRYSIPRT